MSIRNKTILIIITIVLIFLFTTHLVTSKILNKEVEKYEHAGIIETSALISNFIESNLTELNKKNIDWAVWDDMYQFVKDENENFIRSNFVGNTFENLGWDLAVVLDINGKVMIKRFYDRETGSFQNFNESLIEELLTIFNFNKNISKDNLSGLIPLNNKIIYVSFSKIRNSNDDLPSNGYFLTGKYLTDELIENFSELMGKNINLSSASIISEEEKLKKRDLEKLSDELYCQLINDEWMKAYKIFHDMHGEELFILELDFKRNLNLFRKNTMGNFFSINAIFGLFFGIIILLIFDFLIVKRFKNIIKQVKDIGEQKNPSLRVYLKGKDEIVTLASTINHTLSELEYYQNEALQKNIIITKNEELVKLDKMKSYFLAQMSHEIRTPINTILNFSSLIRQELENKASDDLKICFTAIGKAGDRLIRTIDLLILMAEVQTGSYAAVFSKINFENDIIPSIDPAILKLAEKKENIVNISIEEKNAYFYGDKYSVTQIVSHLLDNAVKYTLRGKIDITFKKENDKLVFSISDTGIGIKADFVPYLFTPFSQEEQGYTRKYEGNGLGLALVKRYCEINNADISLESEKGKGTKITVVFN